MSVWEGVIVCAKIIGCLLLLGAFAALFILATDTDRDWPEFDFDTAPLPTETEK